MATPNYDALLSFGLRCKLVVSIRYLSPVNEVVEDGIMTRNTKWPKTKHGAILYDLDSSYI